MRRFISLSAATAILFASACAPALQGYSASSAESEIRARSEALVAAESRKDIEAALAFWGDDAVVHMEGAPPLVGKAAVRSTYQEFFASGFVEFTATITDIEVARSGELAYETGVNNFTFVRGGQRVVDIGKYLVAWRRGSDGVWRVAALAVTNNKAPQ